MKPTSRSFTPMLTFTAIWMVIILLLSILPLPSWLNSFRPAWAALLIIHYSIAFGRFISVLGLAWCIGLLLDVLYGSVLGMHALALLMVAYVCHFFYKQMRVLPFRQQAIWVLLFVFLHQLLCFFIKAFIGEPLTIYMLILPAISSMLIWPLFARILLRTELLI